MFPYVSCAASSGAAGFSVLLALSCSTFGSTYVARKWILSSIRSQTGKYLGGQYIHRIDLDCYPALVFSLFPILSQLRAIRKYCSCQKCHFRCCQTKPTRAARSPQPWWGGAEVDGFSQDQIEPRFFHSDIQTLSSSLCLTLVLDGSRYGACFKAISLKTTKRTLAGFGITNLLPILP